MSVLIAIVGQVLLFFFLVRCGMKPTFAFGGTPVYTDCLYVTWCKENNKPYMRVIICRVLSILSAVLSAIVFKASITRL